MGGAFARGGRGRAGAGPQVGRGSRGGTIDANRRGLGWAPCPLGSPWGRCTRAPAGGGGSGGEGGLHLPLPRARAFQFAESGWELEAAAGALPCGPLCAGPARAGSGGGGGGSLRGRRSGPAEPWRPRSRRPGGAGNGSGRTRVRTRATFWRRARAAAGRSGGSRWARRVSGDAGGAGAGNPVLEQATPFLYPFGLTPTPWRGTPDSLRDSPLPGPLSYACGTSH